MTPILSARGIRKSYSAGRSRQAPDVLRAINLDVWPGEFVAIVGRSGTGKSTLLYCLSSLLAMDAGTLVINGVSVHDLSRGQAALFRRAQLGFVFQQLNLIESLSAAENIALPARLAGARVTSSQIAGALDVVGLAGRGRSRPYRLSGGEQQRVAIARALVRQPPVLFADEPTGSLDVSATETIMDLFRAVVYAGSTLVMVTHDLDVAARADRVIVLRDGIVGAELHQPSPASIFTAMEPARSA